MIEENRPFRFAREQRVLVKRAFDKPFEGTVVRQIVCRSGDHIYAIEQFNYDGVPYETVYGESVIHEIEQPAAEPPADGVCPY